MDTEIKWTTKTISFDSPTLEDLAFLAEREEKRTGTSNVDSMIVRRAIRRLAADIRRREVARSTQAPSPTGVQS